MSKETRGRPTKEDENHFVKISEMATSYDTDSRLGIAIEEVTRFLHSTARKGKILSDDVSDMDVFGPFVLSMLWQIPVHDIVGGWLVNEAWDKVDRWKRLCDRWRERWGALSQTGNSPGRFISGWRMASMVMAWKLLDEYQLESAGMPSVEEISGAAVCWLNERGIPARAMALAAAENKTKREFEKVALEWLPRSGLKKAAPPLFPEGFPRWLEGIKETSEPGYEPYSWPAPRREDMERFKRRRIEELEFLRVGCPASSE
jgi:hypothetical protein